MQKYKTEVCKTDILLDKKKYVGLTDLIYIFCYPRPPCLASLALRPGLYYIGLSGLHMVVFRLALMGQSPRLM
jgi:hypothetical protein